MKLITTSLLSLICLFGLSQTNVITTPVAPADKALVIFIRPAELNSALDNWVLMEDEKEFCRISNNRFVTKITEPGKHTYSAKRGGIGIGKVKVTLDLEMEAGKTYFVHCDIKTNLLNVRLLLNEVTKSTATKFLQKAKPDNCELTKEENKETKE